jgi:polyferredoxin
MAVKTTVTYPRTAFDLLRLPLVGRLLKSRYGRLLFQIPFLLIAVIIMYDGFTGQQRAAENLATVIPWVHYRGLVVLALLLAGNLFCMGCPFTISRTLAKRLSIRGRRFPRPLRNKWLAIAALFSLFFVYEWLDLWASPILTAWVILAYFVASFVLEAVFTESAFCKYVCPLGTFNFVYSTASPTQITSRSLDICRICVGHECVNGSYSQQPVIRLNEIGGGEIIHDQKGILGCGTQLFVPQMQSNLDCVLCLDCVRACPHDNVGLMARLPGHELWQPDTLPKRWDVALLFIGLTFLGVINAFGMINSVYGLMQDMARTLGLTALGLSDYAIEGLTLLVIFLISSVILPFALSLGAGMLGRTLTRTAKKYDLRHTVASFAPAFIPLGFGIWIGHYGFHFLTGASSIIPAVQTFLIDHRIYLLGTTPDWSLVASPNLEMIGLIQVAVLVGGFLWSMVIAQRVALHLYRRDAVPGLLPWALVLLGLMLFTIWVFSQPMEMRGTILFD